MKFSNNKNCKNNSKFNRKEIIINKKIWIRCIKECRNKMIGRKIC